MAQVSANGIPGAPHCILTVVIMGCVASSLWKQGDDGIGVLVKRRVSGERTGRFVVGGEFSPPPRTAAAKRKVRPFPRMEKARFCFPAAYAYIPVNLKGEIWRSAERTDIHPSSSSDPAHLSSVRPAISTTRVPRQCKVSAKKGTGTILINSKPATIMTDPDLAGSDVHRTHYRRILSKRSSSREHPDALLADSWGDRRRLNTAVALAESGVLQKYGVELIGASLEAIRKAERPGSCFKAAMDAAGLETPRGGFVPSLRKGKSLLKRSESIIIRPSFTLGGSGGGIARTAEEFDDAQAPGNRDPRVYSHRVEVFELKDDHDVVLTSLLDSTASIPIVRIHNGGFDYLRHASSNSSAVRAMRRRPPRVKRGR